MTDLPDVNIWLALSVAEHPHHSRALRYWQEEAGERLAFCRITALGFLRLLTSTTVMRGQPLQAGEAWSTYRTWLERPNIVEASEPDGRGALLGIWAEGGVILPRLWTDAYLAAFALSGDMRMVTIDADFSRFPNLNLLRLDV